MSVHKTHRPDGLEQVASLSGKLPEGEAGQTTLGRQTAATLWQRKLGNHQFGGLMRQGATHGGHVEADASVESAIETARGAGHGLHDSVRKSMEGAMGADFSQTRVHTDARADMLNRIGIALEAAIGK